MRHLPSNITLAVGLVGWWNVCQHQHEINVESEPNAAAPRPPPPPLPRAYVHFVDWLRGWVPVSLIFHTGGRWRRGVLAKASLKGLWTWRTTQELGLAEGT